MFVEGVSDRVALEVLARRRGLDLAADGVTLVSMDGITNLGHFLERYLGAQAVVAQAVDAQPAGRTDSDSPADGLLIAGLYDDAEERFVRRALKRFGYAPATGVRRWRRGASSAAPPTLRTS